MWTYLVSQISDNTSESYSCRQIVLPTTVWYLSNLSGVDQSVCIFLFNNVLWIFLFEAILRVCHSASFFYKAKCWVISCKSETLLLYNKHCFRLLYFGVRPGQKCHSKVTHRKEVTHSNGSYERKLRGRKLADEMGRGKKMPMVHS